LAQVDLGSEPWRLDIYQTSPKEVSQELKEMQLNSALSAFVILGWAAIQADATSLRRSVLKGGDPAAGPVLKIDEGQKPKSEKGVGDLKEFANLLPFHPRGQQELLMKTRCVNFLNHLLEKSAYAPDAVGDLMPKCKWHKAECKALKDDLMKRLKGKGGAPGPAPGPAPAPAASFVQQRSGKALSGQPWPERKAPKGEAVTWISGPRGPQPDFVTEGGMDESIYGWCDVMYDMMRKKAINELDEEQKEMKERQEKAEKEAKEHKTLTYTMEKEEKEDDDDDAEDKKSDKNDD